MFLIDLIENRSFDLSNSAKKIALKAFCSRKNCNKVIDAEFKLYVFLSQWKILSFKHKIETNFFFLIYVRERASCEKMFW